ncbi:1-aminocyclopropane-1-carboxylate deaminase/D-cysteine desulfhydrase [Aspergillus homomorphus CBS 101889]|uniref:Tryptophan synthase beta subunit-like PLP-dependent enzyme n=1 Tax=Aspergillus homomorphus (strain CBS 101889) TaxID=1450537 RepID=A0A395HMI8_ASPHC|nr:tryptophan synthase beta subunit-like PLP-dependent enzyme [Aspergillus homomorphus CBS 101889]RAL09152.1 tryptophan synthase beta subunit-like PLP-dependent enzyme [Aspergillus homomorphus CBS 101889]
MTFPLPNPLSQIPRHPLLYAHPSPLHPLPTLTKHFTRKTSQSKIQITLHTKREDQASPLASSGNKYRKLEYIIPDILSPTPKYGGLGSGPDRGSAAPPTSSVVTDPRPNSQNTTTSTTTSSNTKTKTTTLVTEGALQSNHTVQVAALARHLGLDAVVILHKATGGGWGASSDRRAFARTGNVQIARLLGADVRVVEGSSVAAAASKSASSTGPGASSAATQDTSGQHEPPEEKREDPVASTLHSLQHNEQKVPYWIPSGASLHPLGGLGYARCAFEIVAQEGHRQNQDLPDLNTNLHSISKANGNEKQRMDYIFVACGSGSTLGGLIAGFKLLEKMERESTSTTTRQQRPPRKIIGVLTSPTSPKSYHEERVLRFARQAAGLIGLDPLADITPADVRLEDRFVGTGYGVLDAETKAALETMARTEGVLVDPVYTAKVARAMMHWVRSGELEADWRCSFSGGLAEEEDDDDDDDDDGIQKSGPVNVLFIHTGGQSALSAYADVD